MDDILYSGFYPRIHDQKLEPRQVLGDYFETYVERDVRRIGEIRNLPGFRRFVRLCAGRVGQLVNLASLGADTGVSHTTARHWIALLEASLHRVSSAAVPCQHSQASGQDSETLLL